MISELSFIRDYTSFWRTISPLSEDFTRKINIIVLDKIHAEMDDNNLKSKSGLINEIGFEIFARSISTHLPPDEIISKELDEITVKISSFIFNLRSKAPLYSRNLETTELEESREIAIRLLNFFQNFQNIIVRPYFQGCGRLGACQGDVIADNSLYEIKSGNRKFKSVDLRQLVLYLSLNHYSKQYDIQNLGLYNPRKGYHYSESHEKFSQQFCGLTTEELCHRIGYELTSVDMGRFDLTRD